MPEVTARETRMATAARDVRFMVFIRILSLVGLTCVATGSPSSVLAWAAVWLAAHAFHLFLTTRADHAAWLIYPNLTIIRRVDSIRQEPEMFASNARPNVTPMVNGQAFRYWPVVVCPGGSLGRRHLSLAGLAVVPTDLRIVV